MNSTLSIERLREIGGQLREAVLPLRYTSSGEKPLERGASGDKTFRIDRVSEEIIISGLERAGLPLSVVSEEKGAFDISGGGHRVLIDPIDGSKNAVTGIPMFCASIAVTSSETISDLYLAYIINILTGDEFWAERDKGAFLNGRRIRSQQDDDIRVVLYETQMPGRDIKRILPLLSLANRTRCFGTTALDLALLALGAATLYVNPAPTRSFDYAAGILLVSEAGGVVTDINGNDISNVMLSMERTPPLLVGANKKVHEKALEVLKGG